MQAIETSYAGCRFRSRLEARWAVFFDALEAPWEYEPEGFILDSGKHYLPDFYLPAADLWIEVKGKPDQPGWDLVWEFAQSGQRIVFLCGDIPLRPQDQLILFSEDWDEDHYTWAKCASCGAVGIALLGWVGDLWCRCFPSQALSYEGYQYSYLGPEFRAALTQARSARFEHGQTPSQK